MIKYVLRLALIGLAGLPLLASATNTAGVHGPIINPNDRSMQYRFGFSPGEGDNANSMAHRLHYQYALNESFRARLVTHFKDKAGEGDFQFADLRAELLWYVKPRENGIWDSGVRFDLRARRGSSPELFTLNWVNEWKISDKWRLRGLVSGSWNMGPNAPSGMFVGSRASASYRLDGGNRVGIDMFNEYGAADDMGSFNQQSHSIGPVYSGKASGFSYQVGYLAGLSNGAPDHTFRFWVGKSF